MTMQTSQEEKYARLREKMVEIQIVGRGIQDERVIQAMKKVPRHFFVPPELHHLAYKDTPLPIGEDQTISQPYIVAYMTAMLELKPEHRVLEIGTGSGYQTAILAEIATEVYTVEIVPQLYQKAVKKLKLLGYNNIFAKCGDGSLGWPEKAPFDRIIVTAAPSTIPDHLLDQLKIEGILVLPVGDFDQRLLKIIKKGENTIETVRGPLVRFVPMTGMVEKLN